MAVISTQNLTRRFGSVVALDSLSVDVDAGVTGLIGANGAGKSTVIKVLLGLLEPTSGTASVLGFDVATQGSELRALVGYMPEHDCLPPDVTATELVVHMARMSGLPPAAARERASDTLRHVGLEEERYRPIGQYSTGMRQRVKLAQALVHDPRLVLLDEPTNGLDPAGRDEMLALVRRIGAEFGISVLVTSHLLGELERICDSVVVIEGGRLTRHATTAEATAVSGSLLVELDADPAPVLGALEAAGIATRATKAWSFEVPVGTAATRAVVRDAIAAAGLGLVRLEPQRHSMTDFFTTPEVDDVG
ncbi:MAG: ABC transporter ATP-binding protein [Thermoleophilia bacterium]|nr:ABC transporter ATP-binding protein [Thermoleophilia bacterium]